MVDLTFISSGEVSEEEALDAYSLAVVTIAERLSPSVANLRVSRRVRGGRRAMGGGSGVVITPDGFMLTSAHVVAGTDGKVEASFVDGREVVAEVVGADPLSDLAVLRSETADLAPAVLGDAEQLRVGGRHALAVDRIGPAREDDPLGAPLADPLHRARGRMDLAVDVGLAHPARDELGVLRAEIDDEDAVQGDTLSV